MVTGKKNFDPATASIRTGDYMKFWYEKLGDEPQGNAAFPTMAACPAEHKDPRKDPSYKYNPFIKKVAGFWNNTRALNKDARILGRKRPKKKEGIIKAFIDAFVISEADPINPKEQPSKYIDAVNRFVFDNSDDYRKGGRTGKVPHWLPEKCGKIEKTESKISVTEAKKEPAKPKAKPDSGATSAVVPPATPPTTGTPATGKQPTLLEMMQMMQKARQQEGK